MPRQPFLIEGYDNLGALDIGFLGWDQVSLIRVFPVNHESRLTVRRGSLSKDYAILKISHLGDWNFEDPALFSGMEQTGGKKKKPHTHTHRATGRLTISSGT